VGLTTIGRRAELVAALGVDYVRVVPFDHRRPARPGRLVHQMFVEHIHVAEVLVGAHFQFGYRATGSAKQLSELDGTDLRG
jgi:riboflavin kinase/FMN adenylyltransferase